MDQSLATAYRIIDHRREFRQEFGEETPAVGALMLREKTVRCRIGDGDAPGFVEPDHACRHARQHSLGKPAATVDELRRTRQLVVLAAKLRSHLVEGGTKMRKVAVGLPDRNLHIEIAKRHLVRRMDQPSHRRDEPVSEVKPEPDCDQQKDNRYDGVHHDEVHLPDFAHAIDSLIFGDCRF